MRIWREEVFGPVMVVVPFQTDEEAVQLANDCQFGLGSNVFSRSVSHANAVASRIEVRSRVSQDHPLSHPCSSAAAHKANCQLLTAHLHQDSTAL